jgi:hypothetical protein
MSEGAAGSEGRRPKAFTEAALPAVAFWPLPTRTSVRQRVGYHLSTGKCWRAVEQELMIRSGMCHGTPVSVANQPLARR